MFLKPFQSTTKETLPDSFNEAIIMLNAKPDKAAKNKKVGHRCLSTGGYIM